MCVPNENKDLEDYAEDEGFQNFVKLNEDKDIDEQLYLRDQLCQKLSAKGADLCESKLGKAYGCKVEKNFFGKRKCKLDKNIIDEYRS